jgi:ribonuclease T2
MRNCISLGAAFSVMLATAAAQAEARMAGTFVADAACPATQAIRSGKNPGNVSTAAGQDYELLAGNRDQPTHYMILVPGADPERRWVKVSCGHLAGGKPAPSAPAPAAPNAAAAPGRSASATSKPDYVFALSWEPAFCETRPGKSECKAETPGGFDATHFTLHGLWPEPNGKFYCNVGGSDKANDRPDRWKDLPAVTLDPATRRELEQVMPGTGSMLERHEWIKHGTCSGMSQQQYFSEALSLMRAVNGSAVRDLFAGSVGQELTADGIRAAFDAAFGAGAGARVRVACVKDPSNGRRLIGELTLGLAGPLTPDSSLASLLKASDPTEAGCPKGLVDRPRQQ